VPEHVAKAAATAIKGSSEIPKPIENAFGKVAKNKNSDDPSDIKQSALERLPQPTGYRILIIPYYPSEKTKGGIIVPDAVRERESFATVSAYVVKLGPDAYKDAQKFPSGSYANEKDWVLIGRYSGNRFKVEGLEVRDRKSTRLNSSH